MTSRLGLKRIKRVGALRRQAIASAMIPLLFWLARVTDAEAGPGAGVRDEQHYCADIAASVETLRLERRRHELARLETEVTARLQALETRQNELRVIVDRLDSFERNASEALVGLYARMKPEAAAAQLSELDDDVAAALLLQLKGKVSSAILNEISVARGAALVKKISDLRKSSAARQP
jgi:flagellar motility protein MotE (MotC chaperone)